MKIKTILIVLVTTGIFTSCLPTRKFGSETYMLDVRPYTEKGFFISQSNSVSFNYETIGIITTAVFSGEDTSIPNPKIETKQKGVFDSKYGTRHATQNDALACLYDKCVEYGANGIINLQFSYSKDGTGKITSITATAMAIKRTNNQ